MSVTNHRIYQPARETVPESPNPPPLRDDFAASEAYAYEGREEISDPFPIEALPPIIAHFVREVARVQHVPGEMAAVCAVGVLATTLGVGLELHRGGGKKTRGNLYVMVLAPSGIGKSETLRLFTAPIDELETERLREWERETAPRLRSEKKVLAKEIERMERSIRPPIDEQERAATIAAMTQKESELKLVNDQLEPPRLRVGDVTTEKLALLLSKNDEALASISADARKHIDNVLGRNLKSKNTDEDVYLQAFSGDSCRVDRISRESVSLTAPCLSILWLVQPDKFDQLTSHAGMKESGFLPRFLVCQVKGEPRFLTEGDDDEIAPESRVAYHRLIRSLVSSFRLATQAYTLDIDQEARAALRDHYNRVVTRLNSGELGDIASSANRWTEQAWRLAVVLHAALHGPDAVNRAVTVATVQSAIRVADWFARQQLELVEASRLSEKRECKNKIISALSESPKGLTAREIYRRLRLPSAYASGLLNEMVTADEVNAVRRPTERGGHPVNIYTRKGN